MSQKPSSNDPMSVQRGNYGTSIGVNVFFILGRLATGPIQYLLLKSHPLGVFSVLPPPSGGFVSILGHQYPRMSFYMVAMPTALSIKHSLWAAFMMKERMTMQFAFFGVLADLTYECVTSLVFTGASINLLFSERLFDIGRTLFFSGVAIELLAEIQRILFKSKPENKDRPCTSGFWAITRHINYTANVLFGFGVGLAAGGPGYAIATSGMYLSNFILNAMPGIEQYCKKRYGQLWTDYEKKVPYQLIPGIY